MNNISKNIGIQEHYLYSQAKRLSVSPLTVETAPGCWSYALSFAITPHQIGDIKNTGEEQSLVQVVIQVHSGKVGLLCIDINGNLLAEEFTDEAKGLSVVAVKLKDASQADRLIIRQASPGNKPSIFTLYACTVTTRDTSCDIECLSRKQALKRAQIEIYPPTRCFAVVSWGCAATSWLAYALNSHPDIYCVHAATTFWTVLLNFPIPDDADYMMALACQGYAHRLAGDVHGISRHSIPTIKNRLGDRFRAVVVVRDPMKRLLSAYHHLKWRKDRGVHDVNGAEYAAHLARRYSITVDQEDVDKLLFVEAANMLNAVIDERTVGPIFRIEDLLGIPNVMRAFVDEISAGEVQATEDWIRYVYNLPAINPHANKNSTLHQIQNDADFIEIAKRVVEPQAWMLYQSLGYRVPTLD